MRNGSRQGVTMNGRMCAAVLVAASLAGTSGVVLGQSGRILGPIPVVHGAQGYLGVDIRDVTEEQVGALKLREARGAEILRVDHDGPAGKAGLREHDVVLQMNGQVVEGREQLKRLLRETPPGRSVSLLISRDGQQQTVTAQTANREDVERQAWEQHMTVPQPEIDGSQGVGPGVAGGGGAPGNGTQPPVRGGLGFLHGGGMGGSSPRAERGFLGAMGGMPYTGATLEPVGPQLAEFFGAQGGTGLLVRSVDQNSPAATAGLRAGDVVVKVNQTTVAGIGDWSKSVHDSKGKALPVTVLRDRREQTLTLTPDPKRRSGIEWPEFGRGFSGLGDPESERLVAGMAPLRMQLMEEARRMGDGGGIPANLEKTMEDLRRAFARMEMETGDLLD